MGIFCPKANGMSRRYPKGSRRKRYEKVSEIALAKGKPVYLSIDDTVIEKKKPSSQAVRPMEGTGWHYSHLEGKQVFGYQVFGANISTGNFFLCYCLRHRYLESGSKISMTVEILGTRPRTDARIILQKDRGKFCVIDTARRYEKVRCGQEWKKHSNQEGEENHAVSPTELTEEIC